MRILLLFAITFIWSVAVCAQLDSTVARVSRYVNEVIHQPRLFKQSELFAQLPEASNRFRARVALAAIDRQWTPPYRRGIDAGRYHYALGAMLTAAGDADSSMHHFAEAGLIFDRYGHPEWTAQANYGQAYHLAALPDYPERGKLLNEVIAVAEANNFTGLLAKAYALRAYVLEQEEQVDEALKWNRRALALYEQGEQWEEVLLALYNLGIQSYYNEYDADSRAYYERALAVHRAQRTGGTSTVADIYGGLSLLAAAREDYALAHRYLDTMPRYLQDKNLLDKWVTYYGQREELFQQQARYDSAYTYTWTYNYLKDSLDEERNRRATAETMILYRTRDAEADRTRAELESARLLTQRNLTVGLFLLAATSLVALGFLFRQRRKSARLKLENLAIKQESELETLKQENQLNMVQALLEGQETERDRIARDLHDGLGGDLTGLRWTYNELVSDLEQQGYRHAMLNGIRTELGRAYEKVRNLSHELSYSDLRQFGLVSSLRRLVERLELTGKLRVTLGTYGKARRLDTNTEIQLFQLVNELCTNTLKHAGAERISIELTWLPEVLSLIVEDNGCGFDASEAEAGLGLYSMRQRAQSIGASFEIDSRPGRGTTALIDLPLLPVEAPVGA